ncbi:MAG: fibronectin type III domain-containing protein, partial [Sediminibacterium sp.]|nr:fibronectin type III domain-containing protein [Sediminibacterium sp.]
INTNIPNNTNLQNENILNQNKLVSVINSVNNLGAKFINDTLLRKLYGTIATPLVENEILQYSVDNINWNTITYFQGNSWATIIPPTFRGGEIQVRSILNNEITNRKFNALPYYTVSDTPTNIHAVLNNSNNNIDVTFDEPIFKGGYDTIRNYTILVRNGNSIISYHTQNTFFTISGLADNTNYYIQVQVENSSGLSTITTGIPILTNPSPLISTINTNLTAGVISQSTTVNFGSNYTVTYQPFIGYKVDSIFVNNEYNAVSSNDKVNEINLTNVTSNTTIGIVFSKVVYTISTNISLNGTISNAANVFYGDSVPITFTINQGYKLDSILIDEVYDA